MTVECHLARLWNHRGDKPLGMALRVVQFRLAEVGGPTLSVGGTNLWTEVSE